MTVRAVRSLRSIPDAVRIVELGVRAPAGRCGAVEGVALHVIGSDGWLWRIG